MDNLDEFLAEGPEEAEVAPAAEVENTEPQDIEAQTETTAEKPAQPRGPDGKFARKEADEPVMVPLKALHETRDEVKALKAELDQYRAQSQPQQQAPQVPDIFENPEGYAAHLQSQIASVSMNDRLNLSEEMVRQSAGDEAVNAAQEWGKQMLASNPAFAQAFYSQRNPYGFLVKEHQRQQTLAQIGDDPEQIKAFLAWKQAQEAPKPAAQPVPTTLADVQSARGSTAEPFRMKSLDEILGRKA